MIFINQLLLEESEQYEAEHEGEDDRIDQVLQGEARAAGTAPCRQQALLRRHQRLELGLLSQSISYLLGDLPVHSRFLLFPHDWHRLYDWPDLHVFSLLASSVEGDGEVGDLVGLLCDSHPVLVVRAELDKELLAVLSWVGEYDVEVVEGEFLALEADLGRGFVVDLSFHRLDQIESRLVGLDFEVDHPVHLVGDGYFRVHLLLLAELELHCVGDGAQLCRVSSLAHLIISDNQYNNSRLGWKKLVVKRKWAIVQTDWQFCSLAVCCDIIINLSMRVVLILALLLVLCTSENWAVLVAGSHTWSNYRHQADVYHAYQVLIKGGFDANRIITLAYDDIAHHLTNPYKGKVFNKPSYKEQGVDVYAGLKIDYDKAHVTPEVFQAVLEGNKAFVKGKGTERVLESTAADNVFIFFSDHGAPGIIAFPSKNLYADHLISTFAKMSGKYKRLVFYLEACESGSMFVNLPKNTGIYALSAANPSESSWGTYCSPDDVVAGKHIGSCLGDLFSVNFVEDTEKGNYDETLQQQFQVIQKLTDKSHVLQWGDLSFSGSKIGEFLTGSKAQGTNLRTVRPISRVGSRVSKESTMDSRTMKLQSLSAVYARDRSPAVFKEMLEEMQSMRRYDSAFSHLAHRLSVTGDYSPELLDFACLRGSVEAFESKCGRFSDYGLGYIKYLAQACESHQLPLILSALQAVAC